MNGSSYHQEVAQFRNITNILNSDLYGYFGLKDKYNTDQKRKDYQESQDFRVKNSEFEKLRSEALSSTYYLNFQPVYNDVSSIPLKYDPVTRSFSVLNEFDLNNFYDEPGLLQLDRIVFKYPDGIRVKEANVSTVCQALIDETISFEINDQATALKIEENKNDLRLLFLLTFKGTVPLRAGIAELAPADYCLMAELREIVVYNSDNNEIYSRYRP